MITDTPCRVQLSRAKGWRMPDNTVKVDRSTKWGNPFVIGSIWRGEIGQIFLETTIKDAETSVGFFREMLEYVNRPYPRETEILASLRGKNLACWCKPGTPCHADVLLEIANV